MLLRIKSKKNIQVKFFYFQLEVAVTFVLACKYVSLFFFIHAEEHLNKEVRFRIPYVTICQKHVCSEKKSATIIEINRSGEHSCMLMMLNETRTYTRMNKK